MTWSRSSRASAGRCPTTRATSRRLLWGALQHLHDNDDAAWADGVAADPDNPHFAFSVAGTAYFVVGLHPTASRVARRAPLPTLVFNLHEQFERMREDGRFQRMRDTIRRRDTDLQGSLNPMVSDHGETSEARQYSGRAVPADWAAAARARPGCRALRRRPGAAATVPDSGATRGGPVSSARTRCPRPTEPPAYDGSADAPADGWSRLAPQTGASVLLRPATGSRSSTRVASR